MLDDANRLDEVSIVIGLMALAFSMAWAIYSYDRIDRALVGPLAAQIIVLNAEVIALEQRLDAMPECFQLRGD